MRYNEEEIKSRLHTPQLEGIANRLEEDIVGILEGPGIYFRIFGRVKTPFSIVQKLERGGYGTGPGEKKMQDLIGLRIVLYFHDDMSIVRRIMENTFRLVGEWAQTGTSEDEFKATKQNGVFYMPDEYQQVYNGNLDPLPIDFVFEVQIRTVSFESWHEIEHDMRYKSTHGDEFWRNNEDLSRTLNCVLANLELCDWSMISVFDKLSLYHFQQKNWEMMLKGKYRLRFGAEPLSNDLVKYLNDNPAVAGCLYRCDRAQTIFALMRGGHYEKLTYNLLVKVVNESLSDYDTKTQRKLARLCNDVLKEKKPCRSSRPELFPLEKTPSFQLRVMLTHRMHTDIGKEFLGAVRTIAEWVRGQLQQISDGIPDGPVDFELHEPGYNLKILGNFSLGFYKLSMDYIDVARNGVIWRTNVSLEMGKRIRMSVDCDYCHPPNWFVRDSFSKPRFVDEIFHRIGYEDILPLSLKPGRVRTVKDMEMLNEFISNSERNLPVVLVADEPEPARQINVTRLAETVGTYAHVFLLSQEALAGLAERSNFRKEELDGAVWVTFPGGEDKFYTKEIVTNSRFDFNRFAFEEGNVSEKAFRHKLVRLLKEKNCENIRKH